MADDTSTPQPSQSPQSSQDLDEAGLEEQRRKARVNEYMRNRYHRKKETDPLWLEQLRARHSRWRLEQCKDEASRERYLDTQKEAQQSHYQRILSDPARLESFRARRREKSKIFYSAYTKNRHHKLKAWFLFHKAELDTFTWKRWKPVYLAEPVDKVCASCGIRSRGGTRRLWFIRKSDPELWDCPPCFLSLDLSDVVPIEGAERFYNGRFLQPEPAAIEGTVDHKDTHETVNRDDVQSNSREPKTKSPTATTTGM